MRPEQSLKITRNLTAHPSLLPLLLTFSLIGQLFAQQPTFINYTLKDGLGGPFVYYVFQDADGYIWFATESGVYRFNGHHFHRFSKKDGLPDDDIFTIHQDSKGRIWFLGFSGSPSYYHNGKIYNPENEPNLNKVRSKTFLSGFLEDSHQNVWLATDKSGLFQLSPNGEVRHYPVLHDWKSKRVNYLWQQDTATIGVISNAAISKIRFNRRSMQHDTIFPQHLANARSTFIDDSRILIVALNHAIVYHTGTGHLKALNWESIVNEEVLFVNSTGDGYLWMGTRKGAYQIRIDNLDNPDPFLVLPGKAVTYVLKDREGNTWLSTIGDGVWFTSSTQTLTYNIQSGFPDDNVTRIERDANGAFWLGFEGGRYGILKNGEFAHHQLNYVKGRGRVNDILARDNGSVWMAVDGLFVRIDQEVTYFRNHSKALALDQADNIYVASNNGLIYIPEEEYNSRLIYRGDTIPDFSPYWVNQGIYTSRVNCLTMDHGGKLWVGTHAGLFLYQDSLIPFQHKHPALAVSIKQIGISSDGSLWVGTSGAGMVVMNDESIEWINRQKGLSGNYCNAVFIDSIGQAWVATNKGINKIILEKGKLSTIQVFDSRSGHASDYVNDLYVDGQQVWAATYKGLSIFRDEASSQAPPPIYITSFIADDSPYQTAESITLNYHQNDIKIDFVALSYQSGQNISYRYKLAGIDSAWRTTKMTSVSYPAMQPGAYEFIVTASNTEGRWNDNPSIVRFQIDPPFWQAWWFRILLLLIAGAVVYAVFKVNILTYNRDVVKELIQLIIQKLKKEKYLIVKEVVNGSFVKIPINSILRIAAAKDYIEIHTSQQHYLVRLSMKAAENQLLSQKQFLRIHRSHIVNTRKIDMIQGNALIVQGQLLPIGRIYTHKLKALRNNGGIILE